MRTVSVLIRRIEQGSCRAHASPSTSPGTAGGAKTSGVLGRQSGPWDACPPEILCPNLSCDVGLPAARAVLLHARTTIGPPGIRQRVLTCRDRRKCEGRCPTASD